MTGIFGGMNAMEAAMPTFALAMMVAIIEILFITLAGSMSGPIRVLSLEILPVMRVVLIPRMPLRRVPVCRPDNTGGRIGVIRGPAILSAVKIMQDAIQEPITLVKDPGRIRPHPRRGVNILGRGRVARAIGLSRGRHGAQRPPGQKNCQCHDET